MEISRSFITHYLGNITVSWFNDHDLPPDDIDEYHNFVLDMKFYATKHNDLEKLRLAFEYLLAHPEINTEEFAGSRYGFDDEDMREIIRYAYQTMFPDALTIPPAPPPDVTLVP